MNSDRFAPKVNFECSFRPSNAAYARFGRALIEHNIELADRLNFLNDTIIVLVCGSLSNLEKFRVALKPQDWHYYPPRVFDNGTLIAKYDSPEDEIDSRVSSRAERILRRINNNESI